MRALKALVIVLGILLVFGTGVLIWGIARQIEKMGQQDAEETTTPAVDTTQAVAAPDIAPWGRVDLKQPYGTRIQSVTNAGDYIVLHLYTGTPGTDERVMVIEPGTGTLMGTVTITQ
jgi:hypothetical protein